MAELKNAYVSEEMLKMSDGVKLFTLTAYPKGTEKCPIVYIRTPYEETAQPDYSWYDKDLFIKNGYAVILQHCRGTGNSEGNGTPYVERDDGLETLKWIRTLPFYNEEIYLFGRSYLATAHYSYLDVDLPDIKGAVLNIQSDRMYFSRYCNGCCYNYNNASWWLGMIKKQFPDYRDENIIKMPYKDIMKRALGEDFKPYTDVLLHDTYDDFWKNSPKETFIENLKIPVLFFEGWYDKMYTAGMFDMWRRLPEETRKKSAFIIGPWGHALTKLGDEEYDLPNDESQIEYSDHEERALEWFESIRNGNEYKRSKKGQIRYYSIGGGRYYITSDKDRYFPLRFYLNENSTLSKENKSGQISYRYDPAIRNNYFKYNAIKKAGKEIPEGIITFESEPPLSEKTFFGKIRCHLNVSTDCDETAFFVRVYFVENGEAYNLTETIASLKFLNPNYRANTKQIIDISTPEIAFTLKKGTHIRVDISSDGGIFVPNPNVSGHWALVTETKVAQNTVYFDDSYIELNEVHNKEV